MTHQELVEIIRLMDEEDLDLMRRKNHDYAGVDDAFHNLQMCESYGVPAEKGILVRMSDKMTRISNLLAREAQITEEKLDETLKDLGIYSKLFRAFLRHKVKLGDARNPREASRTPVPPFPDTGGIIEGAVPSENQGATPTYDWNPVPADEAEG